MPIRLRIATYNVEDLGGRAEAGRPIEARAEALRRNLMRLNADLLCLQEVNAEDVPARHDRILAALDRVLAGTRFAQYQRIVTMGPSGDHPADKHNLVLLSRFPVETSRQILHDLLPPLPHSPVTASPPVPEPLLLRFDRPFQHAAVTLPNRRRLHIINLHLKAPLSVPIPGQKQSTFVWRTIAGWAEGFFLASLKRSGQALEARLFVDRLFDREPDALIAVCGDLNADCHEVPVRIICGGEDDTGNPGLSPRVLAVLGKKLPEDRRYSVIHAGRRVMLDHILVSRELFARCCDIAILNENLADEAVGFAAGIRPADSFHAAVVTEFLFAE